MIEEVCTHSKIVDKGKKSQNIYLQNTLKMLRFDVEKRILKIRRYDRCHIRTLNDKHNSIDDKNVV
ncbi:hypothetical protein SOV_25900 [Sporomusa ovata DSM 2662]|uniref:hypothetical protein n=1 Tax=Sporomusa ovata TaxID=2378 RepID=UPI0003882D32|nr:hypothetical protein [Sporomusa ovata]EQB25903.1 hypothetical protein SOV_4c05700 [Sporomusa ovata DSM 2662]